MCGITGFLSFSGKPAAVATLAQMVDLQRHRGPNDQGMRLFSLARGDSIECQHIGAPPRRTFEGALGFNRLSILDLSKYGHQPMCNQDASAFIAFNGEIYNAFSYTAELQASGFQFRSRTDTEVILYLYERHGFEGMLERLNGMFSIVIVDLKRQEINIARDHFGIKPFYWTVQGKTFLFSSEVKSFLAHPDFARELDLDNLDEYLTFRYCAGDRHLLKSVRQLQPGHWLRVRGDDVTVHRYWQIPDHTTKAHMSMKDAVDRLDVMLRQSVQSQLLSDVKVGCQLSGGIDSSLVTLFARTHFDADMETFSVVFHDPAYSEEHWISQTASMAMADSHRFLFTKESFFQSLEMATWHLDQPLNHPNSLGLYLLAKQSRKLVTVLLSGEGADELFGGYPRFYYAALLPRVRPWLPTLQLLPKIGPKFTRIFGDGCDGQTTAFILASQFLNASQVLEIRPEASYSKVIELRQAIFAEGQADYLSNCLKYDMQTYMVDLLVRQDKMTMAHSIENRVPFLDRELVEFVRTLPMEYLVGDRLYLRSSTMRNTKIILKQLARRTFDNRFAYRMKSGFGLPLHEYYMDKRFEQLMEEEVLPTMHRRGVLRADAVEKEWRNSYRRSQQFDEALWIATAFELWARLFLDGIRPNK